MNGLSLRLLPLFVAALVMLSSCDDGPPPPTPDQIRQQIKQLLPPKLADSQGWADDIYTAFDSLKIRPVAPNVCATLAVIEQESRFNPDPVVPGLAKIARAEIDRRAASHHVPLFVVRGALSFKASNGQTYEQRLAAVKTEKDLDQIFEDMIDSVPMGRRLLDGANPVHTAGPMQVSIGFAEQFAKKRDYPYTHVTSIRNEVFTRRGGVYFGVAHLLGYKTNYPALKYRFADYNAGFYASRNAAFQRAVSVASGLPVSLDGDLVKYGRKNTQAGATELAVQSIAASLTSTPAAIHADLQMGDSVEFENTDLYREVFALAERKSGKSLPRQTMPNIQLESPKITRKLTTEWFATRVEQRFQRCLARAQ